MELQEIDIFVEKDGQIKIEIRGAKGLQCLNLTKDLEAVLGSQILDREMTPEADESSEQVAWQQQHLSS
jgi:hypothetical protein